MSAEEIRRKLLREAGIETTNDARTGIVALVTPDPAHVILKEIEKEAPSTHRVVRIIRDFKLGFVSKAYQSPPDSRSMYLITLDPEWAASLLKGFVNYVRVDVPLDWGTWEQRITRAWERAEEIRQDEAERKLLIRGHNALPAAATPQAHASNEVSEYPPSSRSRRVRPYLHLLNGPQTVQ